MQWGTPGKDLQYVLLTGEKPAAPPTPSSLQHHTEVPPNALKQRKNIIAVQIDKEETKLSLFADDVIIYI
jgi:hypothetical protein